MSEDPVVKETPEFYVESSRNEGKEGNLVRLKFSQCP